jgi:hypothetical protein
MGVFIVRVSMRFFGALGCGFHLPAADLMVVFPTNAPAIPKADKSPEGGRPSCWRSAPLVEDRSGKESSDEDRSSNDKADDPSTSECAFHENLGSSS